MFSKLKYLLCFALPLLIAGTLHAQQDFAVTGVLFEKGSTIRIALAEVKNKRSRFSVGSNDIGIFTIKASIGDTLLVTKRNFSDLQVVVKDSKDLVLYLNKGTMLNEVVVTGQTKKQALNEVKKDFKNKGSFYGGKPPLLSFIFSPLTAFYELFGRTPKQARRFNQMYQSEMQDSHVDQYYNKTIINQQTGLTGKELEDFLVNYRPTYDQAKNWNVYDGIKWINDSYKKYSDTAGKVKSN
jgi:hypothetical protein